MAALCKFCGRENVGERSEWQSCPVCGQYCMKKCPIAASGVTWHSGACLACARNPYRQRYTWDGKRWVLKVKVPEDFSGG